MNKYLLKKFFWNFFKLGQSVGVDILPRHFYSEIPNIRELEKTNWWRQKYNVEALGFESLNQQIANFNSIFNNKPIVSKKIHHEAVINNGAEGYGQIESAILYHFIKKVMPIKIVQVGCGVTTSVILNALNGFNAEIICVEPYPGPYLTRMNECGNIQLIKNKIQNIENISAILNECDLFFVDSTHTLGPAGEVSRIILEYLPMLKCGAFAHFHDIYFPFDYQSGILNANIFFQHESVLLQAFLSFNSKFQLFFSSSMIFHENIETFNNTFCDFKARVMDLGIEIKNGHFPSSCFIQKVE